MNERIIEMAKQCGDWSGQTIEMNDVGISKFAQLIVRECLSQVDKMEAVLEDDKEKTGVAWAGLAIAKHFGVDA